LSDTEHWIFAGDVVVPVSDQHCLIRNNYTGASEKVTWALHKVLGACSQFRALEEHAKEVEKLFAARMGEADGYGYQYHLEVLERCARQGLLVSARDLIQRIASVPPQHALNPLKWIGIRTADRPAMLQRLLDSLVENEERFGGRYRYVVVDDSRTPENARNNQESIRRLAIDRRLDVRYLGHAQQAQQVAALKEVLGEHRQSIEFFLERPGDAAEFTGGRVANHLLLLTAGRRFMLMDDDMVCTARHPAAAVPAIRIGATSKKAWFFSDPEEALGETLSLGADVVGEHARWLGGTLAQTVAGLEPLKLDGPSLRDLGRGDLEYLNAGSRIILTLNGTLGDPGTPYNHWLYTLEDDSRARFIVSEPVYERSRRNRCVLLAHTDYNLCPRPSVMTTTATGVDNREMLPPFSPSLSNEDGLFGAAVAHVYPSAIAFQLPWALYHLPDPARTWSPDLVGLAAGPGVLSFLMDVAQASVSCCTTQVPEHRLRHLAVTYAELSEADDGTLAGRIMEFQLRQASRLVVALNRQLQRHGETPHYWARDVRRLVEANLKLMTKTTSVPHFLREPEQRRSAALLPFRKQLAAFGGALHAWPALWRYAREVLVTSTD
jgi:hypothetical protein